MFQTSDLRFALGIVLPAGALYNVTQQPGVAAAGAFAIWASIAMLEATVPALKRSPPANGARPALSWLLRLYVPLQLALIVAGGVAAQDAGWLLVFGLAFTVGFVSGAQGITYAHELGHSRHRADRFLAWVLMTSVNYPQFMVEHYRGHHVRAATWDDPASARRGKSLWRFLPRTLAGTLREAWRLEALRSTSWLRSPLLWCTVADVAIVAVLAAVSWKMLALWLAQSPAAVGRRVERALASPAVVPSLTELGFPFGCPPIGFHKLLIFNGILNNNSVHDSIHRHAPPSCRSPRGSPAPPGSRGRVHG